MNTQNQKIDGDDETGAQDQAVDAAAAGSEAGGDEAGGEPTTDEAAQTE